MDLIRCKNCGSTDFEPVEFHLKCKYCGSFYIATLDTPNKIKSALKLQGFKLEEGNFDNEVKVTHPDLGEDFWFCYIIPLDLIEYEGILKYYHEAKEASKNGTIQPLR